MTESDFLYFESFVVIFWCLRFQRDGNILYTCYEELSKTIISRYKTYDFMKTDLGFCYNTFFSLQYQDTTSLI